MIASEKERKRGRGNPNPVAKWTAKNQAERNANRNGGATNAELERDTALLLAASVPFIGSKVGLWKWAKEAGWSPDHYRVIRKRVEAIYAEQADESAEEVKKRLLRTIQEQLPRCQTYKFMQGPIGIGPVAVADPETGRPLVEIDHGAIQGYQKITMDLVGLTPQKGAENHLHLHGEAASLPPAALAEQIEALRAKVLALRGPSPDTAPAMSETPVESDWNPL